MKLDVVFICQQGTIEANASVLAASLHSTSSSLIHLHVIQPVPAATYGTPSPATVSFLRSLGAEWYEFSNPISDDYKIGNKLNGFSIRARGDRIVFLDSDIVVRQSLERLIPYLNYPFAARAAAEQKFSRDDQTWQRVYDAFNLTLPSLSWPAIFDRRWGRPYFNAGVVCARPDLHLSDHWIDTARIIRATEGVATGKWLDQIALAVAVHRQGVSYRTLPVIFNYPRFSPRKEVFNERFAAMNPVIVHYGKPRYLQKNSTLYAETVNFIKSYQLEALVRTDPGWDEIFQNTASRTGVFHRASTIAPLVDQKGTHRASSLPAESWDESSRAPERFSLSEKDTRRMLFITGIPRSGTSLLSQFLHKMPNVVILSEPREIRQVLHDPSLKTFYATYMNWRMRIARGEPLENRWDGGEIISDTWERRIRGHYVPRVTREDFVLGSKNTLAYLTRLRAIKRAFPGAHIILLVRHPSFVIGSWKKTFPHLRRARIMESGLYTFADHAQRILLAQLDDIQDEAVRRAGLWDYMAKQIIECGEPDMIVTYESLVADPLRIIEGLYHRMFPGPIDVELPRIETRNVDQRYDIDEWDHACIRTICSDSASVFGYHDL